MVLVDGGVWDLVSGACWNSSGAAGAGAFSASDGGFGTSFAGSAVGAVGSMVGEWMFVLLSSVTASVGLGGSGEVMVPGFGCKRQMYVRCLRCWMRVRIRDI